MLSELRDPYSRFVSPRDFQSMLKYDVSGVGLNLGTAEDLEAKTVRGQGAGGEATPAGRRAGGEGERPGGKGGEEGAEVWGRGTSCWEAQSHPGR